MLGAIAGDIIGSVYEFHNVKKEDFPLFSPKSRFTDDTVLTCATADAIISKASYLEKYKEYYRLYPNRGYGGRFKRWAAAKDTEPYNSWGNGSAMRVSPIGFAFDTIEKVLKEAKKSAEVTHNHPEGIKGAQAVAAAIFLARQGKGKDEIKKFIQDSFGYDLNRTLEQMRYHYHFDISCQGSVPQAITAFLLSSNFEDAIRKAISIGGDSDTIACMVGGIAEAFYGSVPDDIKVKVFEVLDGRLRGVVGVKVK